MALKEFKCIKVLGGSGRRYATVGDIIIGCGKEGDSWWSCKGGGCKRGSCADKKNVRREDGSYLKFDKNAIVIIDNDGNPKGHSYIRRSG